MYCIVSIMFLLKSVEAEYMICIASELENNKQNANFSWFDGTQSGFTNWAEDEPNGQGKENCVEMYVETGEWNDFFCFGHRGYVCKVRKLGES